MFTDEVVASIKTAFPSRNIRTISTSLTSWISPHPSTRETLFTLSCFPILRVSQFQTNTICFTLAHRGVGQKQNMFHVCLHLPLQCIIYLNTPLDWYISNESKQKWNPVKHHQIHVLVPQSFARYLNSTVKQVLRKFGIFQVQLWISNEISNETTFQRCSGNLDTGESHPVFSFIIVVLILMIWNIKVMVLIMEVI